MSLSDRLTLLLVTALVLVAAPFPARAQTEPPLEDFEGAEEWPRRTPGDFDYDADALGLQRGWFEARFEGGPAGPTAFEILIDVTPIWFQGDEALIINYTTRGTEDGNTGSIDALWVDRETFEILHRVWVSGGGATEWAGPYQVAQHRPDLTTLVRVNEDGTAEEHSLDTGSPKFDFATMGYLFGLAALGEGDRFRIPNIGVTPSLEARDLFVRVGGITDYRDPTGQLHRVRQVRLLTPSHRSYVVFRVIDEPPFFLGYTHILRQDADSEPMVFEWHYVEHETY